LSLMALAFGRRIAGLSIKEFWWHPRACRHCAYAHDGGENGLGDSNH